jgi:hypothetical protein
MEDDDPDTCQLRDENNAAWKKAWRNEILKSAQELGLFTATDIKVHIQKRASEKHKP